MCVCVCARTIKQEVLTCVWKSVQFRLWEWFKTCQTATTTYEHTDTHTSHAYLQIPPHPPKQQKTHLNIAHIHSTLNLFPWCEIITECIRGLCLQSSLQYECSEHGVLFCCWNNDKVSQMWCTEDPLISYVLQTAIRAKFIYLHRCTLQCAMCIGWNNIPAGINVLIISFHQSTEHTHTRTHA